MEWIFDHEYLGTEFDWVAADSDGHLACFSINGAGPIVSLPLDQALHDGAFERVKSLPITGEASPVDRDALNITEWLEMAERGLYAYDWDSKRGVYRLVAVPGRPVRVDEIQDALVAASALRSRVPTCFAAGPSISPFGHSSELNRADYSVLEVPAGDAAVDVRHILGMLGEETVSQLSWVVEAIDCTGTGPITQDFCDRVNAAPYRRLVVDGRELWALAGSFGQTIDGLLIGFATRSEAEELSRADRPFWFGNTTAKMAIRAVDGESFDVYVPSEMAPRALTLLPRP
jgi:hypothetical protein